jgi:hypothetical protein
LLVLHLGTSAALAAKKDDAWAACIWSKTPKSAANWLLMPEPERRLGIGKPKPEYLLGFRVEAACHDDMTPAGEKGPPSFNTKNIRASLAKSKPSSIGPDISDPRAFQCTRYFLNDQEMKNPAEYKWGFGDPAKGKIFTSIQYFFAAQGGGSVGLPETGGLRKCQWINDDGSLTDA